MLDYDLECLLVELELCAKIALPCAKESNQLTGEGGGDMWGLKALRKSLEKAKPVYCFCEIRHIKSNHVCWSNAK